MGQVSIKKTNKQEIHVEHTEVTLSFKHFSRMETWPIHIEKSMLHILSFEIASELCLIHMIIKEGIAI